MDLKDRIRLIIEHEGVPSGAFAESIGVQQSTLSHILNGRNKASLDVVMKIHHKYPHITLDWLLDGKGSFTPEKGMPEKTDYHHPSLFDENPVKPSTIQGGEIKRKETPVEPIENRPKEPVTKEVIYVERPIRKITEIRIFFDDNTYETFKGEK